MSGHAGALAALKEVWGRTAGTIEELGQAMGLLREAIESSEGGNAGGAAMCAADAGAILFELRDAAENLGAQCFQVKRSLEGGE